MPAAWASAAYAVGLIPFVLLRSFTAPFYARGDTATPVKAALLAAAVNIALKVVLMTPLAQVGLALATAIGAWINLGLLALFARRQGFLVSGAQINRPVVALAAAGLALTLALYFGQGRVAQTLSGLPAFRDEATLALLMLAGAALYVVLVLGLLGRTWLRGLTREVEAAAGDPDLEKPGPPDPTDVGGLPDGTPPPPK